jgi:hypothetical protein
MLNFENAQVLSLSQNSQFLGSVFRYAVRRELTVEGTLNNLTNFSGVSGIVQQGDSFFSSDSDYQEILINGYSFGRGRINSLNLAEGNDVRIKPYTANITCYLSGDYSSISSNLYSGFSSVTPYFAQIETISESLTYTRNQNTISREHSLDLQLVSGVNSLDPKVMARQIARVLFDSVNSFGQVTTGDFSVGQRLYRESYDVLSNQCSFGESYTRPIETGTGVIFTVNTSFNRDAAGISTVTENGEFELLSPVPNFTGLNLPGQKLNELIGGAYNRCNSVFLNYSGTNTYPLYTGFVSLSRNLIPHESAGNYSVSYTNDPRQISGVSWEYANEINKVGRFYNVTENGFVIGHGNPKDGFRKAKNFYPAVQSGVFGRVTGFYSDQVQTVFPLYRTSDQKSLSEFEGNVSYSVAFTDDPAYGTNDPLIKTEEITLEDSAPVQKINTFNIFNFKEIVQPAKNSTLGNRSLSVSLVGQPGINLNYFKEYARGKANSFVPTGEDTFLNSLTYSYTPNEKTFELSAGWTFFRDAKVSV